MCNLRKALAFYIFLRWFLVQFFAGTDSLCMFFISSAMYHLYNLVKGPGEIVCGQGVWLVEHQKEKDLWINFNDTSVTKVGREQYELVNQSCGLILWKRVRHQEESCRRGKLVKNEREGGTRFLPFSPPFHPCEENYEGIEVSGALQAPTSSWRPFGPSGPAWLCPMHHSGAQAVWPTHINFSGNPKV